MYPTFQPPAANEHLLNEVAQTSLSIDPVLFCYGVAVAVTLILWTIGVLVFGRPRKQAPSVQPVTATQRSRRGLRQHGAHTFASTAPQTVSRVAP